jgi:hypothetical protein
MLLTTVGPLVVQQILARRQARHAGLGQGELGQILRGGQRAPAGDAGGRGPARSPGRRGHRAEAEKKDPSVIDKISQVYAQQPQLVKMLGGRRPGHRARAAWRRRRGSDLASTD